MNQEMEEEYFNKFPEILRMKLANHEIVFPEGTRFLYEKILAYRGVIRGKDDNTPVNRSDMQSYYAMGKIPRGVNYEANAQYYAISLFKTLDGLRESWKFPKPNKKVAQGYVHQDGGPQYTDSKGHISWWLYEDCDISGFVMRDDLNG